MFAIMFWLCRNNLERAQFALGYFMHFFAAPFMNLFIFLYSIYYSDDLKWGKTREVIVDLEENGRICHQ